MRPLLRALRTSAATLVLAAGAVGCDRTPAELFPLPATDWIVSSQSAVGQATDPDEIADPDPTVVEPIPVPNLMSADDDEEVDQTQEPPDQTVVSPDDGSADEAQAEAQAQEPTELQAEMTPATEEPTAEEPAAEPTPEEQLVAALQELQAWQEEQAELMAAEQQAMREQVGQLQEHLAMLQEHLVATQGQTALNELGALELSLGTTTLLGAESPNFVPLPIPPTDFPPTSEMLGAPPVIAPNTGFVAPPPVRTNPPPLLTTIRPPPPPSPGR
jgi:hypothetical protein